MIKFHGECVACLTRSALKKIEGIKDEKLRAEYMQKVCAVMAEMDIHYGSAPMADMHITRLRRTLLNVTEDYAAEKRRFNRLLMGIYDRLCARVGADPDPVLSAVRLAMAGNYIDFNVVKDVNEEKLYSLIENAAKTQIDPDEYGRFCSELEAGGTLVYLHDNCGEIVLDKLLIETILARYPQVDIVSVVREAPVTNDACMEDAVETGLDRMVPVYKNGIPDLPGTQIDLMDEKVRGLIEGARMVIAKGQGNFETLIGCGLNVYYLFLCKCDMYVKWFGLERFSGMFVNEKRLDRVIQKEYLG